MPLVLVCPFHLVEIRALIERTPSLCHYVTHYVTHLWEPRIVLESAEVINNSSSLNGISGLRYGLSMFCSALVSVVPYKAKYQVGADIILPCENILLWQAATPYNTTVCVCGGGGVRLCLNVCMCVGCTAFYCPARRTSQHQRSARLNRFKFEKNKATDL